MIDYFSGVDTEFFWGEHCGVLPYKACGDFFFFFSRDNRIHSKQKKVNTAGRVGPKETDYSA